VSMICGIIIPIRARRSSPDNHSLKHAVELIEKSRSPMILAGNGVIRENAASQLQKFAEDLGIPVVTTFTGKGAVSAKSNCYVGTLGLARDRLIEEVFYVLFYCVDISQCKCNTTPHTGI
jgi:thiamine pyrophosphate-dependent acetolactate synthase large subunit-like protein